MYSNYFCEQLFDCCCNDCVKLISMTNDCLNWRSERKVWNWIVYNDSLVIIAKSGGCERSGQWNCISVIIYVHVRMQKHNCISCFNMEYHMKAFDHVLYLIHIVYNCRYFHLFTHTCVYRIHSYPGRIVNFPWAWNIRLLGWYMYIAQNCTPYIQSTYTTQLTKTSCSKPDYSECSTDGQSVSIQLSFRSSEVPAIE